MRCLSVSIDYFQHSVRFVFEIVHSTIHHFECPTLFGESPF